MTHTIILLLLVVAVAFTACEVVPIGTTAKLKALQKKNYALTRKHKKRGVHHAAAQQGMAIVSPEWLGEYRNLEADHGNYTIPDDHRIQIELNGRIKVPQTVVKHFNDLTNAPSTP
jgi:hypothetical protein